MTMATFLSLAVRQTQQERDRQTRLERRRQQERERRARETPEERGRRRSLRNQRDRERRRARCAARCASALAQLERVCTCIIIRIRIYIRELAHARPPMSSISLVIKLQHTLCGIKPWILILIGASVSEPPPGGVNVIFAL